MNGSDGRSRFLPLWPWLAALGSGVALALCFPPFNQGWLVWLALTPWIAAVWLGPPARRPWLKNLALGYVAGLAFFWIAFSWLHTVTVGGWLVVSAYMACYFAFWSWLLGRLRRTERFDLSLKNLGVAALAAFAWVAHEHVRGFLFSGFGWNNAGTALHENLALIQIADVTGVAGISFLVVFCNVIAVSTVARLAGDIARLRGTISRTEPKPFSLRPRWDFTLTLALVGATFAYGARRLRPEPGESIPLHVVAVQANIPQREKFDPKFAQSIVDKYAEFTDMAATLDPQLVVWPEAATPGDLYEKHMLEYLRSVAALGDFDLLLGSLEFGTDGDFNIAALFSNRGAEMDVYRKMHLVPFGEYVPLRHSFPLFAMIAGNQVPSDFSRGDKPGVLQMRAAPVKLGALICFEDTVGNLTRKTVAAGAQVLVNVTNDGWFQFSAGSEQHLCNAIFRTIENRRPMIRAANTGVTCAVDPWGRVERWIPKFTDGIASRKVLVPVAGELTFYTRHGEVFALAACAITVITILGSAAWKRR